MVESRGFGFYKGHEHFLFQYVSNKKISPFAEKNEIKSSEDDDFSVFLEAILNKYLLNTQPQTQQRLREQS